MPRRVLSRKISVQLRLVSPSRAQSRLVASSRVQSRLVSPRRALLRLAAPSRSQSPLVQLASITIVKKEICQSIAESVICTIVLPFYKLKRFQVKITVQRFVYEILIFFQAGCWKGNSVNAGKVLVNVDKATLCMLRKFVKAGKRNFSCISLQLAPTVC